MKNQFGEFLRNLRTSRGMTLRDVEERAKVSNAYLSQVERGERGTPNLKVLKRLAEAYGISASKLVEEAEKVLDKIPISKESPPANVEFVSRGYEKLSAENRKALTDYLQHLVEKEKKGKRK